MGGKFREHGVMLFLDRDLYLAFVKLQADRELGRSFAGLLPFTEGLFQMGYITKEVYEGHVKRYSQPLAGEDEASKREKLRKQREDKELNELFGNVADQWDEHPSEQWRSTWIGKAKRHPELPNAKRILASTEECETHG